MRPKVFCIGSHKTGTTSLAIALKKLGYRVTGPNGVNDSDIEKNVLPMAYSLVEQYDAFQDNPWPIIYKEIDQKYPGSKFILSLRQPDSWIKSQVKHFGRQKTPIRQWIYLVLDLAKGDGWDKLCPFLGIDVPNIAFPHANKASVRAKWNLSNIIRRIRRESFATKPPT